MEKHISLQRYCNKKEYRFLFNLISIGTGRQLQPSPKRDKRPPRKEETAEYRKCLWRRFKSSKTYVDKKKYQNIKRERGERERERERWIERERKKRVQRKKYINFYGSAYCNNYVE